MFNLGEFNMKKTLIALAAFAATAAFAQSSVTLYGIADAYVGQTKGFGGVSQTVVNSGGLSQSRIGLSVKEDLGSGLQAFVVVENAVDTDTGAGTGNRKSVLGLSGSFGTVSLGAQQDPVSQVVENVLDAQSDSRFSTVAGVYGGSLFNVVRNSVRYDTPNFDGFTAAVQVGLGEDKNTIINPGRASRDTAFNVQYANGPLAVALAHGIYETNSTLTGSLVPVNAFVPARLSATALAGSYDFGAAKLNLGFTNAKTKALSGNDKGINVGVTAPIGAFTVVGQLSRNKASGIGLTGLASNVFAGAANANGTSNRTSFGLEGHYALSKRTTSYVGFNQTKDANQGANADKSRVFGVGVRHVF